MDSSTVPSTSSICICTSSSKSAAISSTPSEAMPTPSYRPPARGFHIGPFGLIAALLLLFCWDDSLLPLANAQSELAPSFPSAHPPSPTSVSLVMVAPSADSPTALVPSGGIPSDFPISDWHRFPYARTNPNQQQQQQTGLRHQNAAKVRPTEGTPDMSPSAVWARYQQTLQQQRTKQQQQWPALSAAQPFHNNVGWPNAFSAVANPQNGAETIKKAKPVPSSPFEEVPSFRSQYSQNRRKFAGGLSRLVISSEEAEEAEEAEAEAEEEEKSAELEQRQFPRKLPQQTPQRPAMITPDANHPSINNLERYMPLLARHRPPLKNMTTHWSLANSAELSPSTEERNGQVGGVQAERGQGAAEEEDGQDETGSDVQLGGGPCVSANCRTWITITIPSELVGLGGGQSVGEAQQKERPPAHKAIVTQGQITQPKPSAGGWTKPDTAQPPAKPAKPNVSQPMQPISLPKSRGMPTARGGTAKSGAVVGGPATTTSSTQTNLAVTTRQAPPDFVFSTKWILPVNGISVRPNATAASPAPAGSNAWQMTTSTPPTSATATPSVQPFTTYPKPKVPPANSISSPQPPAIPRERPSDKIRPPKPWTHSGGKEKASNVPKSRPEQPQPPHPMPPTTDTTIEQAAIWVSDWMGKTRRSESAVDGGGDPSKASTELIDAIREALAKFRVTLTRQGARSRQQRDGTESENFAEETEELRTQLHSAWDSLKGTWLEQAVAELAMDAAASSGGAAEINEGKIAELLQRAGLMDATEVGRIKGATNGK
uniref:Uncharacterized protein n=1 Tax=Globodera rostochiensis TaxID=31243 RepID=A0A914I7N7_GLORO